MTFKLNRGTSVQYIGESYKALTLKHHKEFVHAWQGNIYLSQVTGYVSIDCSP